MIELKNVGKFYKDSNSFTIGLKNINLTKLKNKKESHILWIL